ncbi:YitT family protein [Uliginosibacterium sediminicola]|uniref:YitT family protein n=1 Tax=Uliginosibacterium sediminicola TaxID=2024550 RepID=A0ABU9YXG9_9RHOO
MTTLSMPERIPHSQFEDLLALLIGTLVVSFGASLLKQAGALTGGMAGVAFLIHYATGIKFGYAFFLLNVPFYWLAFLRMGKVFVFKTFCAVALVSVFTELHPRFIDISHINPFYAAIFANAVMGLGFIVLFRHKASLGGINILALYLQERYNIRAGKVMMGVDVLIVLSSLFLVSLPLLAASICGAVVLNLIIAMNHRPNRYLA